MRIESKTFYFSSDGLSILLCFADLDAYEGKVDLEHLFTLCATLRREIKDEPAFTTTNFSMELHFDVRMPPCVFLKASEVKETKDVRSALLKHSIRP